MIGDDDSLPTMRELRERAGLKLGTTKPWEQRRWTQLLALTREHLCLLCEARPLAYVSVMKDLGFSVKQAQDLKRYFVDGGDWRCESERES